LLVLFFMLQTMFPSLRVMAQFSSFLFDHDIRLVLLCFCIHYVCNPTANVQFIAVYVHSLTVNVQSITRTEHSPTAYVPSLVRCILSVCMCTPSLQMYSPSLCMSIPSLCMRVLSHRSHRIDQLQSWRRLFTFLEQTTEFISIIQSSSERKQTNNRHFIITQTARVCRCPVAATRSRFSTDDWTESSMSFSTLST
jgi:hypothetical protein